MTAFVVPKLIVRSSASIGNVILQINHPNQPCGPHILKASRDSHVRIYIPQIARTRPNSIGNMFLTIPTIVFATHHHSRSILSRSGPT